MSTTESLDAPWIILDGDFTGYACETHAREYAESNGIPEAGRYAYTITHEGYGVTTDIYALPSWDSGETDYPVACECGQYLDVSLTREGRAYMIEDGRFPTWLMQAHNINSTN